MSASPSSVVYQTFGSRAVRGNLRFHVYLPAGYRGSAGRYPVVYLLSGLPSAGTRIDDGRIRAVGAKAAHHGRPVIVVTPQASRPSDTDPEYHDWGSGRDWETAIAHELVHVVDKRFRTIASRRGRALIGISAGGYGAAILAVHHPSNFSVAQSWSGYFYPTTPSGSARLSVGGVAANRRASVHSYIGFLKRTHSIHLGFYVGNRDPDFVADNRRLHRELSRAGVHHHFAIYPGGHTGTLWGQHETAWTTEAVNQLAPAR